MLNRLTSLLQSTSQRSSSIMASAGLKSVVPTVPTALASYEVTSQNSTPSGKTELATFAHGCFWGTQQVFEKYYGKRGIIKTAVGYTGGSEQVKNPTYRQVCSGTTNHAEALRIEYDPDLVGYAELVEFFYRTHDPTTLNQQGNDHGTQYRSVIFTHSPEQATIAQKITSEVQEKHFDAVGKKIVTTIEHAGLWYDAEEYHQFYLDNNPNGYHCFTHVLHW